MRQPYLFASRQHTPWLSVIGGTVEEKTYYHVGDDGDIHQIENLSTEQLKKELKSALDFIGMICDWLCSPSLSKDQIIELISYRDYGDRN